MMRNAISYCRLLPAIGMLLAAGYARAQECPDDVGPNAEPDPSVPTEVLEYRVKPLTVCELEADAALWLSVLKDKVTAISDAEVAAAYKRIELETAKEAESALQSVEDGETPDAEQAEEVAAAVQEAREAEQLSVQDESVRAAIEAAKTAAQEKGEAVAETDRTAEQKAEVKTALLERATDLMAERTAIIDRFEIVLDELKAKGGTADEYEAYIKAVSGIKVDVTDASSTWTTLKGWLGSPEGGLRWAMNFVQFVVIVLIFFVLSALAGKAAQRAFEKSKKFSTLLQSFLIMTARRLVLFVGFFIGLSALEVNVGPVLAVVGAAGFVIAFALQNSLSNFASGILMLVYRPFDIKDFVNVAGVSGTVESMNLLSTQLRTPDNQLLVIPNNSVWGDVITNITGITQRRVDLVFGIGYDDDIDKAQAILEDIVAGHELVLEEPQSVVKLHELADSSVNFVCRPWVKPEDYWNVYWDITREVKRRFDAEGVSIPFPQRDVHIHQKVSAPE